MSNGDKAIIAARLEARLVELHEDGRSSGDARAPVALDQQSVGRLSRVDALQMQAMSQAQERRRRCEKGRVEAALLRLDSDDYGYCVACGEEIGLKRLEFDPAATTCIRCAGRAD